jgi:putative phage-type endonuclease
MEQRSDEWFAARLGKVTASRVADVVAKTRSGPAASRGNYMAQIVAERLTGKVADSFSNAAMQWGTEQEPNAVSAYEFTTNDEVVLVGSIDHPTIAMSSASPDGLIAETGMVEVKCPNTATHIAFIRTEKIPNKYILQMQWQMACAERDWCQFISYDPRLPPKMQLLTKKVERDDEKIAELEGAIATFLDEVAATVAELQEKFE